MIGLGMMSFGDRASRAWHLSEDEAEPLVRAAAEGGVTFFDTADMYDRGASEVVTGRLLRKVFPNRDGYTLATKVFYPMDGGQGLSRKRIMAAVDASLTRLGTDYIDLYQIHRWDYGTPIEETMAALHDVVQAGKARRIGASSMFAWQLVQAQHAGPTPFATMQHHYNLAYREEEREMVPCCLALGVDLLPYSPLARGFLVRPSRRTTTRSGNDPLADSFFGESDYPVVQALHAVAAERGLPPAQIALAWLLGKPGVVTPIVGATKLHHVTDALAAVDVVLSGEEVARLEAPYRPHRILGHS